MEANNSDTTLKSPEDPKQPVSHPVKRTSRYFLIVLCFLVLLLLVGGSYYLGVQNTRISYENQNTSVQPTLTVNQTNTPTETQSPNSNETANWKTYNLNTFTFKYPNSFSIKSESDNNVVFVQNAEPFKGLTFLEVSINETLNYKKLRQCKVEPNMYENDEGDCYTSFKQTKINNIDGFEYLYIPKNAFGTELVFETKSYPYIEFKFHCYGGGCDTFLDETLSTLELKR